MSSKSHKKIQEPGKPLREIRKPRYPKPKIHKAHKDWFGARDEAARLSKS